MTIVIMDYQARWPEEFKRIAQAIRAGMGPLALRIDHIGSTSVPNLAAKDIIDIQVTVQSLDAAAKQGMSAAGYTHLDRYTQDHLPPTSTDAPSEWSKWMFRAPAEYRPIHLHMRVQGRPNQRYALLFRDYLRTHPLAALAYGQVKQALAKYHAENVEAYYDVKDPVCDIIMANAEEWAATTHWAVGPSDA